MLFLYIMMFRDYEHYRIYISFSNKDAIFYIWKVKHVGQDQTVIYHRISCSSSFVYHTKYLKNGKTKTHTCF